MDDQHREILRRNRSAIIREIHDIGTIVYALEENGVITNNMLEDIMAESTPTDKKREMLNILSKRGPKAFDKFYEILDNNKEGSAADILKPELSEQRKAEEERKLAAVGRAKACVPLDDDDDYDLPETWPDMNRLSEDVTVKVCEKSGQMYERFIRSNTDSGQKMLSTVNEFSQLDHSLLDSFILFILSHGEKQGICGVDGKLVQKEEIIGAFNGKDCPKLSGKPKLFFFQACQGHKFHHGAPIASAEPVSSSSGSDPDNMEHTLKKMKDLKLNKTSSDESRDDTVADIKVETSVPAGGDVFIASATIPDYLSYRDEKKGTWFIQAIVYIFKNFAHKEDISKLMTKASLIQLSRPIWSMKVTPTDDVPLSHLVTNGVTLMEYARANDSLVTCAPMSDDSIVEEVLAARTPVVAEPEPESDTENDDTADLPPPSLTSATDTLELLTRFVDSRDSNGNPVHAIGDLTNFLSSVAFMPCCNARQTLLTDFVN
ncbi:caspase-9-like isoform X2 [Gigantopelta aegis]|uniref:caspase-9-like isoform X2 n=1 Tax=Gigantopelta aegis TaxID=1735272 RepID=UPI001B888AA0|nr:caspase-9-like isoform X2 [Gigantopelta aegis]